MFVIEKPVFLPGRIERALGHNMQRSTYNSRICQHLSYILNLVRNKFILNINLFYEQTLLLPMPAHSNTL